MGKQRELFSASLAFKYGVMGERIGVKESLTDFPKEICVGDLVTCKIGGTNGVPYRGIIVKANKTCGERFGVMGIIGKNMDKLDDLQVVLPHTQVTEEIVKFLHNMVMTEIEIKVMTLEELEDKLGYKIKIVESK